MSSKSRTTFCREFKLETIRLLEQGNKEAALLRKVDVITAAWKQL